MRILGRVVTAVLTVFVLAPMFEEALRGGALSPTTEPQWPAFALAIYVAAAGAVSGRATKLEVVLVAGVSVAVLGWLCFLAQTWAPVWDDPKALIAYGVVTAFFFAGHVAFGKGIWP